MNVCTQKRVGLKLMLGVLSSHLLLCLVRQCLSAEHTAGDMVGPDSWLTMGTSCRECLCHLVLMLVAMTQLWSS